MLEKENIFHQAHSNKRQRYIVSSVCELLTLTRGKLLDERISDRHIGWNWG